jgi:hypothetical protein
MDSRKIIIDISRQKARLMEGDEPIKIYSVSTAANGTGCELGSQMTPLGRFIIYKKIGTNCEAGTVFKNRIPTTEICTENPLSPLWQSTEDLILSRILWLDGIEDMNANTKDRYIYLHGTNQEHLLGQPVSHGCIRFSNKDIIELFDQVEEGTEVLILP